MELQKTKLQEAYAIKISAHEQGSEVGRIYVYILFNGLHKEPFGLLEDLFVDDNYRGQGLGSQLLTEAIAVAKQEGCYKLLCTSRHKRLYLHEWYQKHGFKNHGIEFRMDFDEV